MSKTKRVTFCGHSDDTFGYYFPPENNGDDHDDCARGTVRTWLVASEREGERICVTGVYGAGCMWSVGLALLEDDDVLPDWVSRAHWGIARNGYSIAITMDMPDDATITLIHPARSGG